MKKLIICLVVSGSFVFAAPVSHAKPKTILWKTVNGVWDVRVDKSMNYGCFIFAFYPATKTQIRFGYYGTKQPYILVGNEKWKSLDRGKAYPISIKFDKHPAWTGDSTAGKMGSYKILFLKVPETKFFLQFGKSHTISISYKETIIAHLSLKGSYGAVVELLKCQRAIREITPGVSRGVKSKDDPFSSKVITRTVSDPFVQ